MRLPLMLIAVGCSSSEPSDAPSLAQEEVEGMLPVPTGRLMLGLVMHSPVEGFQAPTQENLHGPPPKGPPLDENGQIVRQPRRSGGLHNAPLDPILVEVEEFWLDTTEVTREAYAQFVKATGYPEPHVDEDWAEEEWNWKGASFPSGTGKHPVVLVNWYDAQAYCAWKEKRLPTEAEWQRAALGTVDDETVFPWGNQYDPMALNHGRIRPPNFDDSDGYETTSPVGSYPSGRGRFGHLDLFGNAWEYTADFRLESWDDLLGVRRDGVVLNPHTPPIGHYVSVRGGSYFFDFRPNPGAERNAFLPELRRKTSGFRCARSEPPDP